jgi:small subunit ribosomal protein S4e
VQSAAQARNILRKDSVMVNGKRVYDTDSAVGFMDVLTVGGKGYRVIINQNSILTLAPVPASEDFIIQKITGKAKVHGGKTQLACASGRTLLADNTAAAYKVGDSIQIGRDGKVSGHYALAQGASVLLTGGSHIGKVGTIDEIKGNVITVSSEGAQLETSKRHAYVIGKGKPAITLA